jgi:predicted phage terminase large subunit-like protein
MIAEEYLLNPKRFITEILGYQVQPFHAKIFRHIRIKDKTIDLAPRGFGKSTIGDIAYCIWRITQDRNIRILVVSNTQRQAEAFIREIKSQLVQNIKLTSLFGTFIGEFKKWTESEIIVTGKTSMHKESTITGLGASGQVISKHFDLIIGDDIVDFENARTELQREKLRSWFYSSLLPTLEPNGELHIVGTRYHPLDLYQTLIDSKSYDVQIQRAIQEDGTSLWPEKFSIDTLNQKKEESGSLIFNCQYQNDVELLKKGNIFLYDWIQWYDLIPPKLRVFQGVDLAISQSETADYFVICTIGMDTANNIYVLDMYRNRLSFDQQIIMIKKKAEEWSPIRIGIEINQYQRALAQELIRTTQLPIKQLVTVKDKVSRMQRRSAEFENGRVYLKKSMHIFLEELVMFPDAKHDDCPDAYDMSRQVSDESMFIQRIPDFGSSVGVIGY